MPYFSHISDLQLAAKDLAGFRVDIAPSRWGRYHDFSPLGIPEGRAESFSLGLAPGFFVVDRTDGVSWDRLGPRGLNWTLATSRIGLRPSIDDQG